MAVSTYSAPVPWTATPMDRWEPSKKVYTLDNLVSDIKQHLGESSGLGSDSVDEDYLISLAEKYASNPSDWAQYYYNCPGKNYTRNAIENINHQANILLLVWNPGKGSPIHDHADAHCILKVLAGELTETVYENPLINEAKGEPLRMKSSTTHGVNDVTYISDTIGLHRVHNPSSKNVAVSLHLYTPPNAADIGYHIFDEATGKASFVPQAKAYAQKE